ncbi:PREDICTED: reticulon-1-A-like isoform X3 [Branchiostoma belcheri]|uniref:Reticulon-like protein n=2 Tax=Branchiostoma belcheri TaxID=7741 RepID=A0A6P5A4D4_BRABE|nr:PREDICTED: reticulon-1-A-like isoform X3 [Branchiostoma belcheri]KAI8482654.1 Reticulon-4 [Branchiostoma belcheri]
MDQDFSAFEEQTRPFEGNNLDDFVQVGAPGNQFFHADDHEAEGEPVSSSGRDEAEEDLYLGSDNPESSEAQAAPVVDNLLDFGFEPPPKMAEPISAVPDSSAAEPAIKEELEPVPEPAPAAGSKWLESQNIDPRVLDLVYWKDPKVTGGVFGGLLVLLLSLTFYSVLSVVAYLILALLTVTISFRVYKNVLNAVQKSNDGHPFKEWLDQDINISTDTLNKYSDKVLSRVNCITNDVRRLILVEDLVDSVKFAVLMWLLTYVGAWFNGMTLMILALVGAFTLPKVYELYQPQIDQYVGMAKEQIDGVVSKVKDKVPLLKKKEE